MEHLRHLHRHQDGWNVWATEHEEELPEGKYWEHTQCQVCGCQFLLMKDKPIPEGTPIGPPGPGE